MPGVFDGDDNAQAIDLHRAGVRTFVRRRFDLAQGDARVRRTGPVGRREAQVEQARVDQVEPVLVPAELPEVGGVVAFKGTLVGRIRISLSNKKWC
jgi:hypothetical protein